ncbi:DUF1194 domain-containing protein [Dongia deserti]|uniref:DUF1194 domain-containing protein n=1 Tax=Dongia deserti TaxID=2268030 RepID=UPI000E65D027|nr:DUF1194 domain-containing protein [Dongia deserti]
MRRSAFTLVLAAVLWAAVLPPVRAADMPVDLELILAVDVSLSMDVDEQQLQRDGYVAALTHPDVVSAITQGRHGKIALSYVEWAGPTSQYTVMDWRLIDGPASARAFAAELARAPIQRYRFTSISGGLAFAAPQFDNNGYESKRRVIDVSGDGPNNMGIPIEMARAPVISAGITINGLPIMIKRPGGPFSIPDLDVYYEDCVIGGAGAFLVVVRSTDQFAEAIRRKLVLEIAGRTPQVIPAAAPAGGKRIDCLIGEKLREQWMRD